MGETGGFAVCFHDGMLVEGVLIVRLEELEEGWMPYLYIWQSFISSTRYNMIELPLIEEWSDGRLGTTLQLQYI
jgi:hypothetical protein